LEELLCFKYLEKNPGAVCDDSVKEEKANFITPNEFEAGDQTQKLIHYTFVF
jgi:hypothetical protein